MLAGGYDSPVVDTGAYSYPRVCYLGYKIYPRVIHRAILDTGLSYSPMYTLCTAIKGLSYFWNLFTHGEHFQIIRFLFKHNFFGFVHWSLYVSMIRATFQSCYFIDGDHSPLLLSLNRWWEVMLDTALATSCYRTAPMWPSTNTQVCFKLENTHLNILPTHYQQEGVPTVFRVCILAEVLAGAQDIVFCMHVLLL